MRQRASDPLAPLHLGTATPPPFVGRDRDLTFIARAMEASPVLVVRGAVGSGKTRLAQQVAARMTARQSAYIRCLPGDRGVAVWARAERAMDLLPGTLARALHIEPWLLIIDDAHHLAEEDVVRTLAAMLAPAGDPRDGHAGDPGDPGDGVRRSEHRGRLLLVTRDALPLRREGLAAEMTLEGLDESAARELWGHLEETYGPTRQGACDAALARTRGMPLAVRREYARAALGREHDPWDLDALTPAVRSALEAMCVLRLPAAPAAVVAMVPDIDIEAALVELITRQLIDPVEQGRFCVHDVVRDQILASMDPARRTAFERAAAELVSSVGRGTPGGRRLAWDAGDDGALGHLDPVDRTREAVLHLLAAGDHDGAVARLLAHSERTTRDGGGELLGLIDVLRAAVDPARARELDALRAAIAARHGRVAEALEIFVGAEGTLDRVEAARLCYRAGDVGSARSTLGDLARGGDAGERCRAAAVLAEIAILSGDADAAETALTTAFERDRAAIDETVRAHLHLALARVYEHTGRIGQARAALSRAASSARLEPSLAALIEARRSACLAREGRLSEAESALAQAERMAREVDATAVADDVRRCLSVILLRRGDMLAATEILRELVTKRRQRGDEIGALCAEIDLACALAISGDLARAAELISACIASAARRKLHGLLAAAHLVSALIDMSELRLSSVHNELEQVLAHPGASAEVRTRAALLAHTARARAGDAPAAEAVEAVFESAPELYDDIELGHTRALIALAGGRVDAALEEARTTASRAERAGRAADLAEALTLSARLLFARGDKSAAAAAAARAAREATSCGLERCRAHALLVQAALAREEGDAETAAAHVREVAKLARRTGLPVELLVAAEAIEAIAGEDAPAGAGDVRDAASATMSPGALAAAAKILSDLGLTSARPYRVVSAGGSERFVADANPERLRLSGRTLAIDAVREVILRDGETTANLRRRTQLKRLLFLLAGAPGQIFSKEEIVQRVWNVEYHPLRHDAALFTNIMRLRRLLGEDGFDLIRVSDEGYRFLPPKDYLYVEQAA